MGTRPLLVLLFALILIAPVHAYADGKAFTRTSDNSAYEPANQEDQRAVISFKDGTERLLITINYYADPDDQGLWIFPVPGTPETVHIDLWDTFPTFRGRDDRELARLILDYTMFLTRATQLYPLIVDFPLMLARYSGTKDAGVDVHEAVEKWGLRAETVTAPSVEALAEHLQGAGIELSSAELDAFTPYLTSDYVLVVVRVASRAELDKEFGLEERDVYSRFSMDMRRPCLLVEFPAERAFYPMRPTASYGDEYVPVAIYVIGYVEPKADAVLLEHCRVNHYRHANAHTALGPFCGIAPGSVVDYTVVTTFGEASAYTSDFAFEPVVLRGFPVARVITGLGDMVYAVAVAVFLLLSCLSGAAAGALARIGTGRGALLGLLNLVSILGVIVGAAYLMKERRMLRFVTAFSLTFVVLTVILHAVLVRCLGV